MSRTRSPEAAHLERDYLERAERALAGHGDRAGILDSLREHIAAAIDDLPPGEVGLVQMATIIERLGPPDRMAEESSSPAAAAAPVPPTRLTDHVAAARLVQRLRTAFLVGVIGLFVPVVDLYLCESASLILLASALGSAPVRSGNLRSLARLAWIALGLCLALFPLGLVSLAAPAFGLISLPVSIAHTVLHLVLCWTVFGEVSALVEDASALAERDALLRARTAYLIATIALSGLALMIGVVISLFRLQRVEQLMTVAVIQLLMLPLAWLLGWWLILNPLAKAQRALTGAPTGGAQRAAAMA